MTASPACTACAKAHLVDMGLGGVGLECRALPPRQDIPRFARFPTVRPDDYCHDLFVRRDDGAEETP